MPQTILVVDDEEHLRESIAFDFRRKGFEVVIAENGRKAFDIVAAQSIDLIISDIRMPGGDGIELIERLRAKGGEFPPIIFLTGFAEITEADVYALGAKKILSKPFSRKELFETVLAWTAPKSSPTGAV